MQATLSWLASLATKTDALSVDEMERAEAVFDRLAQEPSIQAIQICEHLLDHPQLRSKASEAMAKTGWLSAIETLCRRLSTSDDSRERVQLITEITWNAKDVLNQPEYRALYEPVLVKLFKEERYILDHIADWSSHLPTYDTLHGLIRLEALDQVESFLKYEEDPDYDALVFFFGYFHACLARGAADEMLDMLAYDSKEVFAETSAYYYLTKQIEDQKEPAVREQLLSGFLDVLQTDDVVRGDWAIGFLQYLKTARVVVPLLNCLTLPIVEWQPRALSGLEMIACHDIQDNLLNLPDQDAAYLDALQNLENSPDETVAKWAKVFIDAYQPGYKA